MIDVGKKKYERDPVAKSMAYERARYRQQVFRDRSKYYRKTKRNKVEDE